MNSTVNFTGTMIQPEEPNATLRKAMDWPLDRVLIVGFDEDGALLFGGSFSEVSEINLLLDMAKEHNLSFAIAQKEKG